MALISGSIADRARFGSWLLFAGIFATLVYFPVAAWVWGGGWISQLGTALGFGDLGVIDYAGGTAVHINAGAAALALALVLGRRQGFGKSLNQPHNVPLVLVGTAILWFGWFGFNVGAEGTGNLVDGIPGLITVNTIVAPAAGILGWLAIDRLRGKKPTAVGAASGVIAGLVGITPRVPTFFPDGLCSSASCVVLPLSTLATSSGPRSTTTRLMSWVSTWSRASSARSGPVCSELPRDCSWASCPAADPAGCRLCGGIDLLVRGCVCGGDGHSEDHRLPNHERGGARRCGRKCPRRTRLPAHRRAQPGWCGVGH